eukprot:15302891-Ditylum_brightwellii.AAC.1
MSRRIRSSFQASRGWHVPGCPMGRHPLRMSSMLAQMVNWSGHTRECREVLSGETYVLGGDSNYVCLLLARVE